MARIKLAYIGGGSTRAPGTMASFIARAESFAGSDVVLIDLDPDRLELVRTLAERLARSVGADIRVAATTERRRGLDGCDAVLTSFRPGGFEARHLDESIPLRYGVIGQETQGPGGFFMALRSIHVMRDVVADMEAVCPDARLLNYTNPVNIVSEAMTHHSSIPTVSLCEGPITFPRGLAEDAGLDPDKVDATLVGLNHNCWSVRHLYDGEDMLPLVRAAYEREVTLAGPDSPGLRMLELADRMDALPSSYFQYYYYRDEVLAELRAKPTTRSEDIMAAAPDYWRHYAEQARSETPRLDPVRSRGGIHELELAFDVMDALYNDRDDVWPVNVPNAGTALPGFPEDLVVEAPARVGAHGIELVPQPPLPRHLRGLVEMLAEYQALAAEAAWSGMRREAIQALASNPLCPSLRTTEALYDEMAAAHRAYLPERLLR